jgi:WD40 repeat protein
VANTTFDSVIPLLNDAASLLGEYYHPVCADPLQLYRSALLFMPSCALSMAASDDLLDIRLLSPRNPAWTSDVLIFQSTSSPFQGIQCIVVSPDDALVAAVYEDSRSPVKVWKTSTGQMLRTWTSNDSDRFHALTISFSLDGKQLAIMTPGAVYWWDPHTDIHRIQPIDLKIPTFIYNLLSHSVISADGARLAVGFSHDIGDSLLQSVDLNTGGLRTLLRNVVITSVAVSSDASRIASSSDDGNLRIWNAKDGVLLSTLNNFGLPAVVLAFTPRHDIVTMTDDGTVRMRGAEGCDTVFTLGNIPIAADRKVLSQTGFYSRNNSHMISASALYPLVAIATSEIVFVWDEDTRQLVARRQLYVDPSGEAHRWDGPDTAVAFMSDRPGLIVAPRQEDMSLWNFQAQQTAADTPLVDSVGGAVYSVRFSHDGCFVISGSDGSDLRVWETCSGGLKATIRTSHTHPVTAAEFALRDRSLVLSGSDGGQNMELREAETCRLLQQFDASSRMKIANQLIDFSRDGSQFVTMSRDSSSNILRLYESHTGKVLAEERQSKYFTAISFLPDGSRIIALSNLSMKSWSTLTQPPLRDSRITKIQNLGALPWHVLDTFACSPDSERIVSVSVYQEIHLWHARTGKEIRTSSKFTLLDVETPVPAELNDRHHILRYSPTTRGRFLSCSWAGVVRIWNDDTLEIEKTFTVNHMGRAISHLNHVPAVTACYSPDGERITVAFEHRSRTGQGQIHELKVYEWSTGQLIKELAPIISYDAHEDPGSYRDNFRSTMRLSFSPDGQYVFFLKAGRPRVEVWSLLNGEYIGSLWSPMRTMWTAFSICPVTARLIATCEPKSIAHQVAEAATVSSEVVAQSGLAGVDGTAMCLSIVQDLFEANQTYLCVWDTHGFQLQSTLRCGHDGFQPPHFCFDQGSRTLLKQAPPRHYTAPTVCQIPRLQRPNIIVRLGEWVEFIMRPDGSSPRHYYAEDREDQDRFIKLCYTPADRRPLASALMKSERCPWGPVAVHEHVVAIGSLRGSVTIIDLTSLMLTLESRREKLEEEG